MNFRSGLVKGLQDAGFEVVALSPEDGYSSALAALGVRHVHIAIDPRGTSLVRDGALLFGYYRKLAEIRPDVLLCYTPKPNVYGGLAAHAHGIPVINNMTGLGTAFIKQSIATEVLIRLYRIAFRRSATVFFQNPDDRDLFVQKSIVRLAKAKLIPGSGIDLTKFCPKQKNRVSDQFNFLLVGRLLWDKGIMEYVQAARLVRAQAPHARFQLLGFLDVANRTAIPRDAVEAWVAENAIEYLGDTDDVRPYLEAADCIVLPSYREGLPRTLLEAAAMGKPLIATDVPGCRHVVEEGVNGYLCRARSAHDLADAMRRMLNQDLEQRRRMGEAARRTVEERFNEQIVTESYMEAIKALSTQKSN